MKKWKKSILILSILFLTGFFLKLCMDPEIRIRNFLNRYEEELLEISEQYLSGEKYYLGEDDHYKDVKVMSHSSADPPIVSFHYAAFGLVPAGTYWGFYYSPEDRPTAIMDHPRDLTLISEGQWQWHGEGDNRGITKKIKDNWYYYEEKY